MRDISVRSERGDLSELQRIAGISRRGHSFLREFTPMRLYGRTEGPADEDEFEAEPPNKEHAEEEQEEEEEEDEEQEDQEEEEEEEHQDIDMFDVDAFIMQSQENEVYPSLVIDPTPVDAFRTPAAYASTSSTPVPPRKNRRDRPPVGDVEDSSRPTQMESRRRFGAFFSRRSRKN
ncbi:hypothetical protein MLD38_014880 [Melastoma candidum]|uniref:Uncharacterized protein n=1 Tax=Melastoma candidum TaxID=119954 RepID=A0ACB9REB1_9MYRT|nr:hypothetical protein MLD38_014880 [Melastoma candidum]